MLVSPHKVSPCNRDTRPKTFVNRMMRVLQTQGQIEPLQVKAVGNGYVTFEEDTYGSEIVLAARILGWDTILIHITNRYEQ